jgi:GT2 family glycosyltransferase
VRSLASFQNVHCGEKILVCGCGVSLRDFRRPDQFVTIGVNDVGRLFHPKYLLVVDPRARFKDDRFHYVETSQAEYLFTQLTDLGVPHPNIVNFRLGAKDGVDFSNPNVIHYSVVTPYMALYLAAHMGAATIGLIGVDFTDHHFFGDTGQHAWSAHVADIDEQFRRLGAVIAGRGTRVFNLSRVSRLTAFPKMDLDTFAELPTGRQPSPAPLRLVSYATTPVVGVPAILARCINARTGHYCRCLWSGGDYGNGAVYDGDINWNQSPAPALAELTAADAVVVHNGKVDAKHSRLLEGKAVITMAHNYMENVRQGFVQRGFPGVVVGQYQATLPDFSSWSIVPNPIPLWEEAFQPGSKDDVVTICYTPMNKYERFPQGHSHYWHAKGYQTTMRILKSLEARYPVRLLVVGDRQVPHAEALAMGRQAHIVIDECVTGSYHRTSLEGLAAGCVVVNGVGLLQGVMDAVRSCVGQQADSPFTHASLDTLEEVLAGLIERGPEELAAQGASNRRWMERYWDFASQWERIWQPVVERARRTQSAKPPAVSRQLQSVALSLVVASLNEGEYLRRTIDNLTASLPDAAEIIVVDDHSTDGSTDFLKAGYDHVSVVRPAERLGSARARNFGARHARGKVLVFSDAHVAVPPDWAGPLVAALSQPDVGAVMPAIRVMRYPDDYLSPNGSASNGSKQAKGYGLRWRDAGLGYAWLKCKSSEPYPVPLLSAAFLAMHRNVFAAIGGFDPGLIVWGSEDAELSLRLWTLGYECLVAPGVEVAHLFRPHHPYNVEWEDVLYNKLRLATIHFGTERRESVIAHLRKNGAYSAALARLDSSDTAVRRSQLHSLRRYDDDWFFQKFRSDVSSELVDIK